MVLAAACSGGTEVQTERVDAPVTIATEPAPDPPTTVGTEPAPTEPVAPSTTEPTEGVTILNNAPRPIEPIDPADDPFGERARRPQMPLAPEMQWQVAVPVTELDSVFGSGDVLVYQAVTDNVHSINALDRANGEALWTTTIDDHTIGLVQLVDDVIVVEWLTPFFERFNSGIEAATGEELWRTEPGEPIVTGGLPGYLRVDDPANPQLAIALDRYTLEAMGSFHRTARGAVGPLRPDGETLIEFDLATLEPVNSTRLDRDVSLFDSFAVTASFIVGASDGSLFVYDRTGTLLRELPIGYSSSPVLQALGSGSDVASIKFLSDFVVFDPVTGEIVWSRLSPGEVLRDVQIVGLIEEHVHALATGFETTASGDFEDVPSEVLVAETGEVRCGFPETVGAVRHGFYGNGTMYDLDCEPIWRLPADPEASTYLVDGGIVRLSSTSTGVELTYYG